MPKRWEIFEPCPDAFVEALAAHHPILSQLLWHRGMRTIEEAEQFLHPSFEDHIHDPFLFSHMEEAVARILRALESGERILIFGDYDADGLTGSAVIISTLRDIHAAMSNAAPLLLRSFVPHREKEGYGLQMAQAEQFVEEGTDLVITVDCGICCVDEIARLRAADIDVVVVDHHQFGETLPNGILIHPSIPGEIYPFKHLAAVGVAWKLSCALVMRARERGIPIPEGYEKWLLDLVSIATVTDIVPLTGENRVLETYGLKVLNKTKRPGLRSLIAISGLTPGTINARDIGFAIGPRLNAPSRMEHAAIGLELLLEPSQERADDLAREIEEMNRRRQDTTKVMMKEAEELLENFAPDERLYVFWREDWSPALAGLVAGRMADRFGMPVIAIGKHGNQWIGSGRSFSYYNVTEGVRRAGQNILTRSGGHVQACGFALARDEDVPRFAQQLRDDARMNIADGLTGPFLDIHAELSLQEIGEGVLSVLDLLEPYGATNPQPLFLVRNVEVMNSTTVGKDGGHLRIVGRSPQGDMRTFIAFGMGTRVLEAANGSHLDIVFALSRSEWNGRADIQCKVIDFRKV